MSIRSQLSDVRETLPEGVTLVAVSKTHAPALIEEAYAAGQRIFGESRPQELAAKYEALPKDIEQGKAHRPLRRADPFGRQRTAHPGNQRRGDPQRPRNRHSARNPRRGRGDQVGMDLRRAAEIRQKRCTGSHEGRPRARRHGYRHLHLQRIPRTARLRTAATI